ARISGKAGSRSVRARSRQRRQAEWPGRTSGPTTPIASLADAARCGTPWLTSMPGSSRLWLSARMTRSGRRRGRDRGPVAAPGRPVAAPGRPVAVPGRLVSVSGRPVAVPGRLVAVRGWLVAVPGRLVAVPGWLVAVPGRLVAVPGRLVAV